MKSTPDSPSAAEPTAKPTDPPKGSVGRGSALRRHGQCKKIGVGTTTLHKLENTDPTFPVKFSPVDGGRFFVRWEADLEAWLSAKAITRFQD